MLLLFQRRIAEWVHITNRTTLPSMVDTGMTNDVLQFSFGSSSPSPSHILSTFDIINFISNALS